VWQINFKLKYFTSIKNNFLTEVDFVIFIFYLQQIDFYDNICKLELNIYIDIYNFIFLTVSPAQREKRSILPARGWSASGGKKNKIKIEKEIIKIKN